MEHEIEIENPAFFSTFMPALLVGYFNGKGVQIQPESLESALLLGPPIANVVLGGVHGASEGLKSRYRTEVADALVSAGSYGVVFGITAAVGYGVGYTAGYLLK